MSFKEMNMTVVLSTAMNKYTEFYFLSLLHFGHFQFLAITNNVDEFTSAHLRACSELILWKLGERRYLEWW
jgi:hypothetical protein